MLYHYHDGGVVLSGVSEKSIYVIAGSNGAGKTTFAREFLPGYVKCPRFINPDLIAAGLSPFDPQAVMFEAGRLVLREIDKAIQAGRSFSFETTLSGRTYLRILQQAKRLGYAVHIFYLWVPNPELALARVRERVESGGHNVPEADLRRRYARTFSNLLKLYRPLADTLNCFDNSGEVPQLIFEENAGRVSVYDRVTYNRLMEECS